MSTQNWSILPKFAKKNPAKSAVFYWFFLGQVSPPNLPWNRPIFLRICPGKSFEIWLFSAKIPQNRPIFLLILTFLPLKSCEIGRFFREFAPENPAKFCFFSTKYQKPWNKDVFEQCTSTRSEVFSSLLYLDATNCVSLSVLILTWKKFGHNNCPRMQKVHFWLIWVAQNILAQAL